MRTVQAHFCHILFRSQEWFSYRHEVVKSIWCLLKEDFLFFRNLFLRKIANGKIAIIQSENVEIHDYGSKLIIIKRSRQLVETSTPR